MSDADEKPRAYTVEEMRKMFLDHLSATVRYWATTDISRPEFAKDLAKQGEVLYRLEGLMFSFLVALDGGTGLPAFDLIPSPHESDKDYHQENGENWWDTIVINNTQLHEEWSAKGRAS